MNTYKVKYRVITEFEISVRAESHTEINAQHPSFQNPLPLGWESGVDSQEHVEVLEVVLENSDNPQGYNWDFSFETQTMIKKLETLKEEYREKLESCKNINKQHYQKKYDGIDTTLGILLHQSGQEI